MTYVSQCLADGAVGLWELAEPSGSTATDAAGNSNGTYSGTGVTLGATGIAGGGGATAAAFLESAGGNVAIPDAAAQHVGDVFTIEVWYLSNGVLTEQALLGSVNAGGPLLRLESGTLKISAISNQTALIAQSTSNVPNDSALHYIVWRKNGATNKIRLDGADVTGSVSNATIGNSSGLAIGNDNPPSAFHDYPNGTLAMVAIYPTYLSDATLDAHFAAGNSPGPTTYPVTLTATQPQIATKIKTAIKTRVTSQAQVATVQHGTPITKTATQPSIASLAKVTGRTLAAAVSATGALIKQVSRILTPIGAGSGSGFGDTGFGDGGFGDGAGGGITATATVTGQQAHGRVFTTTVSPGISLLRQIGKLFRLSQPQTITQTANPIPFATDRTFNPSRPGRIIQPNPGQPE